MLTLEYDEQFQLKVQIVLPVLSPILHKWILINMLSRRDSYSYNSPIILLIFKDKRKV